MSASENYIEQGDLIAENFTQLFVSVDRLITLLPWQGIHLPQNYDFDLNPFERIGIDQTTMDTVHLLLLAFLWLDAPENVDQALAQGHAEWKKLPSLIAQNLYLLKLGNPEHYDSSRPAGATFLTDYRQRLVKQVKDAFADSSQTLAAPSSSLSKTSPFWLALTERLPIVITTGLPTMPLRVAEEMELTQMLLFDAIVKELHFEIP